jgi:membrane-bound lytic murein transglycosylase B
MIRAPETCLPSSSTSAAGHAARRVAALAGLSLALGATAAFAQPGTPAPASSASATHAAHATARPKAAAKKKKKSRQAAARDDDAPDSFVYGRRDDVLAFAEQVADERGLDRAWVEDQLAKARYQPAVAKAIMPAPPGSAKNWAAYRARFVEPKRLAAGVQWWQAHAATLADAQQRYGVPPELVAGIVGVESFYGRMTGNFRVLDSLATLAFDFPKGRSDRSAFYRSELRAYLVWCALEGRDAETVRGSFAGAIGWPQFMPSSLLRYAVDYDHDGRVDLAGGGDDVVGSIASYMATFGWQPDMPTHFPVQPPADIEARARLVATDIVPRWTVAQLTEAGAQLPDAARDFPGPLSFVELQNGDDAPSYIAGTSNFYVVTRYNWSAYYALAVIELGAALKREMALAPAARTLPN